MLKLLQRWPLTIGLTITLGIILIILVLGRLGLDPAFELLQTLEAQVGEHFWASVLGFVLVFIVLAALALPVGSLFCLTAGYLFGIAVGSMAALIGASVGAGLTFAMIRGFGGLRWRERLDPGRLEHLIQLLERDATWYLVLLRIIPLAPFFVVNVAASLGRVSGWRFNLATFVGLIPTTIVYAAVGNGLGSVLDARELMGPGVLMEPVIGLPLLALAVLIVISLIARRLLIQPES